MQSINRRDLAIPLIESYSGKTTEGRLYGSGPDAVIFSNMNTNNQDEWAPIVEHLASTESFMLLTYNYLQHEDDQSKVLEDVITFAKESGAKRLVLIGASRGGVTSVKVAARPKPDTSILGIVSISAPVEHEGFVFFDEEELRRIRIPKFLINTEQDECAAGTRQMYDLFSEPKELYFYPGAAHGTEIFADNRTSLIEKLTGFVKSIF